MKRKGLFTMLLAGALICVMGVGCANGGNSGNLQSGGNVQGGNEQGSTEQQTPSHEHIFQDNVCTVCGYYKIDADTDFDALVSDELTEAEWNAAFSEEALDNFIYYSNSSPTGNVLSFDGASMSVGTVRGSLYCVESEGEVTLYSLADRSGERGPEGEWCAGLTFSAELWKGCLEARNGISSGEDPSKYASVTESPEWEYFDETSPSSSKTYCLAFIEPYSVRLSMKDLFGSLRGEWANAHFNAEEGQYEWHGVVTLPYGSTETSYYIKFKNGKPCWVATSQSPYAIYLYGYGEVKIVPPEVE